MLRKITILLYCLSVFSTAFSQLYKKELEQFNKLRMDGNFTASLKILQNLESEAKAKNQDELPKIYTAYTKYFSSTKDYKNTDKYSRLALLNAKNPLQIAYGNYARAYYFYQLNLPEVAIDFAKKSESTLKNNNEIDDDFYAQLNYLFYSIHSQWNDFKLSNFYAEKTIFYSEKAKNYNLLITGLTAKATAMGFGFEKTKNPAYKDSVQYYLLKTLPVYRKFSNEIPQNTYAISNINLANDFYQNFRKNHDKSLKDSINKYLKNVEILDKLYDHNHELRANILGMRAEISQQEGDGNATENYLLNAYNLLKSVPENPSYYTLYNVSTALEEFYKKQNNFEKANRFADEKLEYFQKDFDETAAGKARTLEAKYENEKIKSELALIQKNNLYQKIQKYLLLAIALLIGTTLYFTTKNFKNKLKLKAEEAENLENEKRRAETQLQLENETKARLLAEQKILKLEHEKVQKEALINALKVKQKNEVLKEIKTQISDENSQKIKNTIRIDQRIEDSLDNTKMEIEGVSPQFFENLKQKSGGKLTNLDMKYCAYFSLGLSSKEIATIFNVEPKSIRMTKYRLKQKFGLGREDSITTFMERILHSGQD